MAAGAPLSASLLQDGAGLDDGRVRRKLLLSHAITRLGTQGWLFIAPLVLTRFTPGSIAGPAVWGLVSMLATAFLGPRLGRWADRTGRNVVVTYGVLLQFAAVAGATAVIVQALAKSSARDGVGNNWLAVSLFTVFGIVEKLGTLLSDVSVKREWAPQLFSAEQQQSVNSAMSQIDLTTEVVGPFLAGLLITAGNFLSDYVPSFLDATDIGFVATGVLNACSFWPQLALLRSIYSSHQQFLQPVAPAKVQQRKGPVPPEGSWGIWWSHPAGLQFLSCSYALLYLTVLSPHGALLTAFLQLGQVPSWQLSLVRGAGALLGIVGTMARPVMGRCLGDRSADALSVCWLAAWMLIALLSFESASVGRVQGVSFSLVLFMASVCLGRPGLYSFELGVLNMEQQLVDRRHRSAIGAVDTALTSLATVVMYGSGMYWSDVADFGLLVQGSSFFVGCGALTYLAWTVLFKSKMHRHVNEEEGHGHGHSHSHGHSHESSDHLHHDHTLQMQEEIAIHDDGSLSHEHIIYDPSACAVL
eukprot:TRINITY_DN19139_c0_g2_i1.p1 TRINITY_DN19139_c0_g2~~TRINITY_DN19139_c0_g2_i1.p1  ORF type:complete len:553 (-),score=61.14 TRINITY_DN19139_c0_g2_i1:166-1752(-)